MGASPEQLHQLGHHDCSLCKAEKKTKAEERLIKEALIAHAAMTLTEDEPHYDRFCKAATAVLRERKKK